MAKTWVTLEPSKINKPYTTNIAGVDVNITLPPYDVPSRASSYKSTDGANVVYEFEYALDNDEETKALSQGPVMVRFGKNTKRVHKIEVAIEAFEDFIERKKFASKNENVLGERILYSLASQKVSKPKDESLDDFKNYETAKTVIRTYKDDLSPA